MNILIRVKRQTKFIIIGAAAGLMFSSCHDILDTQPKDFYTADTYWKTANHAMEALTGSYQALTHDNMYNGYTAFMLECITPNAYHKDNYKATNEFARGTQSGTTLGLNDDMWKGAYRGIGRCNNVIENVPNITMDEAQKNRIIAEAKFLRAFYYQKLNVIFNGVPLVLVGSNIDEDAKLTRSTYLEVKSQILKDLDEAIPVLPASYTSSNTGRATVGAALALKAKVYFQDTEYAESVSVMEEIFKLNQYELFPDYNGIFRKVNQGNKEVIFDIRFQAPEVTNSYDIVHAQFNVQAPVQELVDVYQMKDGKPISESALYKADKPYENRDPRFAQTILFIGAPWRARTATTADLHQTGYAFRKYTEYNESTAGTIATSDVNYIEIRYADILLMYAESVNELSGPTSAVYNAINQIRTRPSVNLPSLASGMSKEEMRQAIRLERRIELAGEGSYFYDIRRWKTIDTEMVGAVHTYQGNVIENRNFNPARDYYWPIPYTQIDLNPNLIQNPNY